MIYVASSWRNKYYPEVIKRLRQEGFPVYDFRNPPHGGSGFHWTDVDENAPNWTFKEYEKGLSHPLAELQFEADLAALQQADTCVLVLPCGRSAHTEAGWMAGAGKRVIVYIPEMVEPELMYKLFDKVVSNLDELIQCLCYDGEIQEEMPLDDYYKFGLEPWVGENPKVLILGTMAGDTSIAAQAYYDDPRNPFWRLTGDIFQPSTEELSHGRKSFITGRGIALWDVIASGVRIDSSDASFSESTLQGNDIQAFLDEHPTIHTVVLNGIGKTYEYFRRFNQFNPRISYRGFHSTVSMISYSKKLEGWSQLKKMVMR